MKRLIALICSLALVLSLFATVNVSAIRGGGGDNAWSGWKVTSGKATISGGVATVVSDSQITYSYGNQPLKLTASFNMKVNSYCPSMGMQIYDGIARGGFYIGENRLGAMDITYYIQVPNMNDWHNYVLDIDMEALTQDVYVDDVYLGQMPLKSTTGRQEPEKTQKIR